MGMAKTGGVASNGSGDFVIAFSTNETIRVRHRAPDFSLHCTSVLRNDDMTPLFMAAIEATEEAIINSLFAAHDTPTHDGKIVKALPLDEVMTMLEKHLKLN